MSLKVLSKNYNKKTICRIVIDDNQRALVYTIWINEGHLYLIIVRRYILQLHFKMSIISVSTRLAAAKIEFITLWNFLWFYVNSANE